jgi:glycosyltransferase involved in cell wall biosynthesis
MRIFAIPIDRATHPNANVRLTPLIAVLSKNNRIIGCERVPHFDTSNEFVKRIRFVCYALRVLISGLRRRKEADLILGELPSFGLIGAVLSVAIRKPYIWDTHDGNLLAHCQLLRNSFFHTRLVLFIEKINGCAAQTIVVPSERDLELYIEQKYKYVQKIAVIPSAVDLSVVGEAKRDKVTLREKLNLDAKKRILTFTGSREYPPNQEAADWINQELAPFVAQRFHDVQILIIGTGDVPAQVSPIVTYTGFVPSVYEYIFASDICLVPYRLNTGISTKLLDCMACAKPIIAMSSVARLIPELVDGKNVIIAEDEAGFANKVIALLNDPELALKIGVNARNVIEEHYTWQTIGKKWSRLIEKAVAGGS